MSVIALDFYDENDPNGTALGTLDDADCESMEFRVALHGLGSGVFTINRHHPDAGLIVEDRLVKVRVPSVSASAIFAFWLKEGDFTLISSDEEGGETLTFGGPGIMYILAQARLYHSSLVADQPARGSLDVAGMWTWQNEPYGAILTRIIEEGRESPFPDAATNGSAFEHVTIDFDRVNDSGAVAWPNIATTYEERIGTDMLQVAERLREAGDIFLVMNPNLAFSARQSYGSNRTGAFGAATVRFEKAVNILTELKHSIGSRANWTHLLLANGDGNYSTEVVSGWTAAQRKRWGYFEASQTNDTTLLNAIGVDTLRRSRTHLEALALEIAPGFDPTNGRYMPGPAGSNGHFWVGDTVTLQTGVGAHEFNAAAQLVTAIRVVLAEAADDSTSDTAARSLRIVTELNYEDVRSARWGDAGGTGGPSLAHSHLEMLCRASVISLPTTLYHWGFESTRFDDSGLYPWAMPSFGSYNDDAALGNLALRAAGLDTGGLGTTSPLGPVQAGVALDITATIWDYNSQGPIDLTVKFYSNSGGGGLLGSQVVGTAPTGAVAVVSGNVIPPGTGTVYIGFSISRPSTGSHNRMQIYDLLVESGAAPTIVNDGNPDLVGIGPQTARCDHKHHVLRTTNPTVNDDWATDGYPTTTLWTNTATGDSFLLTTATTGAAVWAPFGDGLTQAEVDALIATHAAAADPHTGYRLESADHTHASTGLQAGTVAHSALTGLTNDEHTQYQQESEKGVASGYASLGSNALVPQAQLPQVSPMSETVLGMTPVSYWRLGEASGTVATDQKGVNNGTYVASPTLGVAGALAGDANTAVTFSGSGQWVTAAQGTLIAPLSVSAWVKVASLVTGGVAGQYDGSLGYLLYLAAGVPQFYTAAGQLIQGTALSVGQWAHLVGTHDGTNSRLYVNGVLVSGPTAKTAPSVGVTPFRIAAYSSGAGALAGSVDEPAIWDRALTATEITDLYAAGVNVAYQKKSEKGLASGYASLGAGGLVPMAQLATGTPDGTKFVRDDGTLVVPSWPAGHYEVIVSGTAPPVAVTNAAEDDWLYGWVPD